MSVFHFLVIIRSQHQHHPLYPRSLRPQQLPRPLRASEAVAESPCRLFHHHQILVESLFSLIASINTSEKDMSATEPRSNGGGRRKPERRQGGKPSGSGVCEVRHLIRRRLHRPYRGGGLRLWGKGEEGGVHLRPVRASCAIALIFPRSRRSQIRRQHWAVGNAQRAIVSSCPKTDISGQDRMMHCACIRHLSCESRLTKAFIPCSRRLPRLGAPRCKLWSMDR